VRPVREIHLWGDGPEFDSTIEEIKIYLENRIPSATVTTGGNLWVRIQSDAAVLSAERVARARIFDLYHPLPEGGNDPLRGEIAYEERRILGMHSASGLLYEGFHLSALFQTILELSDGPLDLLPIVLTDRLVGSFDRSDRRYHARVAIFGYPSIVSVAGVVEAPARPREYYLVRRHYGGNGLIPEEIAETLKGRYLEHGDPRIVECLKGYALQCLFFHAAGEPFCEEKGCRLYNAHWQEELIFAQLSSSIELCTRHEEILNSIIHGEERPSTAKGRKGSRS